MKVYISYSWRQPIKSIVKNWMCPCLRGANVEYIIDEIDCGFGEDIELFEHEIGGADNVLVVSSKSYFHSLNCMFELALIIEHGKYTSRPIWLSVDDYDRQDTTYDEICKYWIEQAKQTRKQIVASGDMSQPYLDKLEKIELIVKNFPHAWSEIKKKNTLNFEDVSEENFRRLIALLRKRQLVSEKTMQEIEEGVSIEQEMSSLSINVQQNGEKSVSQVVNGGTVNIKL